MKSDVYYFTARTHSHKQSMSKFKAILGLKKAGFEETITSSDNVVIKTHFGALENTRYIRPSYIRFLCDYVKELNAYPSVAESCGWGVPGAAGEYGGRANEEEYLEVALKHGFTPETMGAPLLMLDGADGIDYEIQKIDGEYFNDILVAGRLREFDQMIMASHFKGHSGAGFGGAIKNLGIGCVAKGGKTQAHTSKKFEFDFEKCEDDCERCVEICPTDALMRNGGKKLEFDEEQCRYCYMCRSVCKNEVIDIGTSTPEQFLGQMVDNAKGVVDYFGKDKIWYINYAIDITYQCDCSGGTDIPFITDIGVLVSRDPVAIDQACIDLAHQSELNPHSVLGQVSGIPKEGSYDWFSYLPHFDQESGEMTLNREGKKNLQWKKQLEAAEKAGLGNRDYNLINVKVEKE